MDAEVNKHKGEGRCRGKVNINLKKIWSENNSRGRGERKSRGGISKCRSKRNDS